MDGRDDQQGERDTVLASEALAKARGLCRRAQGSERLHGRMYERLLGLLKAVNDTKDASERAHVALDVVKMTEDFDRAIEPPQSGLLALVTGLLLVSKVYETHCRIDKVYARLEWCEGPELASVWRMNWDADRSHRERRLMERVELLTDEMPVRELDAPDKLKTVKRMAFELKLRRGGGSAAPPSVATGASVEIPQLLDATLRRVESGVDLATDKRRRETEERGKKMRGQLLAQMDNK